MNRRLIEARKINKGEDALTLLNNGKLAGMIGGRKFIPQWVLEDPNHFKDLVDATITLLGEGQNIATDETIKYLMKCSFDSPEIWEKAITDAPDTLVFLSTAFLSKWIQEPAWVKKLDKLASEKSFNADKWHDLEKDLQDKIEAIKAKRGKKITTADNSLYTTLYDDGTWKLFRPKSYEGDSALASGIEPFKASGKVYTKTRWCTAANKSFYRSYSSAGNGYYIIQYWKNGKYTDAWQIAFNRPGHVEFMDKYDHPDYRRMLEVAPKEMLDLIICDNPGSNIQGVNMTALVKAMGMIDSNWDTIEMDELSETPWFTLPDLYYNINGFYIEKSKGRIDAIDPQVLNNNSIVIPKMVAEVKESLFDDYDCELREVSFEVGAKKIPESMFMNCRSLEVVVIPNTVEEIGDFAFRGCKGLVDIVIPDSVKVIGEDAFARSGLATVKMGEGVEVIKEGAFKKCNNLESMTLPDSLKEVGDTAFANCSSLEEVHVSNVNAVNWGEDVFVGCDSIKTPEILDNFEID